MDAVCRREERRACTSKPLIFGGYALDRTGDPGIMSAVL